MQVTRRGPRRERYVLVIIPSRRRGEDEAIGPMGRTTIIYNEETRRGPPVRGFARKGGGSREAPLRARKKKYIMTSLRSRRTGH